MGDGVTVVREPVLQHVDSRLQGIALAVDGNPLPVVALAHVDVTVERTDLKAVALHQIDALLGSLCQSVTADDEWLMIVLADGGLAQRFKQHLVCVHLITGLGEDSQGCQAEDEQTKVSFTFVHGSIVFH